MDDVHGEKTPEQPLHHFQVKQNVAARSRDGSSASRYHSYPEFGENDPLALSQFPQALSVFQWKAFFAFLIAACLLILAWSSTSDLFEVPPDVTVAYKSYQEAKRRYFQNSVYWDSKREHFEHLVQEDFMTTEGQHVSLLLETLTPEIFISYLVSKLKISTDRLNTISIMPKESASTFTLIISKTEQAIWPLKIIISLEAEVSVSAQGVSLLFTRLRRGSEDLATGLAWAYFGSDLEALKPLPVISMKASQSRLQ